LVIVGGGVAVKEFHEPAELRMVATLEWHVPATIVSLNNKKEKE